MSQLYDRAFSLSVNGQVIAAMSGNPDAALRVRFKIQQKNIQAPNRIQAIVSNLSDATARALIKEYLPVTLSAGYVGNTGLLFQGKTTQVIKGRESPTDTILQLYAGDSEDAYNHGVISKSFAAGSTPQQHVQALTQALSSFGVTQGYLPTSLLSSPSYPRGVAMAGMVRDYLRTLSLSKGCQWSIQNGALQVVPASGYVPGSPFIMNATSGMIGMPTQDLNGIHVRCLMIPQINLAEGNLIQLNNADIQQAVLSQDNNYEVQKALVPSIADDGIYRVLEIETTGDSRGRDWYRDLTCLNHNLNQTFVPQSQIFNLPADQQDTAAENNKLLMKN